MLVYEIKLNRREVVRTTSLHEARNIAKQLLADKVVTAKERAEHYNRNNPMPYHPYLNSVTEKMYLRGKEIEYCLYANVVEQRGMKKTYRVTIKAVNATRGTYDYNLHKDIANMVSQREQVNEEQGAE